MLGTYENFPRTIHLGTFFSHMTSVKKVQQTLVTAFGQLNQDACSLEVITGFSGKVYCEVNFEVGVGEETAFTFLNANEIERLERAISREALPVLDFLCVLQYHLVSELGKRSPLKFDYFFLRFAFATNLTEFLVAHERGPRRVHVEDLTQFLVRRIETKLRDNHLVDTRVRGRRRA
jgi:hypothetical protein